MTMGFAEPLTGMGLSFADMVETNSNGPESLNDDVAPFGPWLGIDGSGFELGLDSFKARNGVDSEVDAMELAPSCAIVDSASL